MRENLATFKEFMKQREAAAAAYVNGNAFPLERIAAEDLQATFFGPKGGYTEGADEVASKYSDDVRMFETGGESSFKVLQIDAGERVAYWVGFQRATVYMKGKKEPVDFELRVTEIFKREKGVWKLVHRHADDLSKGTEEPAPKRGTGALRDIYSFC